MNFYHEIGRWGVDLASNPTWTWRKWYPCLPAVTLDLCSGSWNRAHIFLHLSLIGLKMGVTKLGRFSVGEGEREDYTGWQQFALQSNFLTFLLLVFDMRSIHKLPLYAVAFLQCCVGAENYPNPSTSSSSSGVVLTNILFSRNSVSSSKEEEAGKTKKELWLGQRNSNN